MQIFEQTGIEKEKQKKFEDAIANATIEKFDFERTVDFINSLKDFY